MALIKCSECGKEISDKATQCVHCGYSIKKNQEKKTEKFSTKIWLIICSVVCFLISIFCCFANVLNISISTIKIGSFDINVMGTLTLLLGCVYIILLKNLSKKNLSKKNFSVLVIINALIFIYNIVSPSFGTSLRIVMFIKSFFILWAVLNLFITLFIVKKYLNNSTVL